MPASTPKRSLPYPLPTEPLADGANAIKNLALALDGAVLVQAGKVTVGAGTSVVVTFPVPFSAVPAVVASALTASNVVATPWGTTTTQVSIRNNGAASVECDWIAVGAP